MITNLTLEGCGVLGCGEAGAVSVLESKGILKGITRIAGVSAGSIVATLLSTGYVSAEIKDIITNTDFSTFKDGNWTGAIQDYERYGLHPGDVFLDWIKSKIKAKTGNELTCFGDLTSIDLVTFACSLDQRGVIRFSKETTPKTPIAYAVRASMSIPGLFQAYQIPGMPDTFVDGGTVMDFPVTAFDSITPEEQTLGICFKYGYAPTPIGWGHPQKAIIALIECALNSQQVMLENSPYNLKRSIQIDTLGISATNFGITQAEKFQLDNSGIAATIEFLSKNK